MTKLHTRDGVHAGGEQVRALHSLCLVAQAAFNFSPYMHNTLGVAMQQLLRTSVDEPAVRPVVASLVNSMVELQGPEFSRQASTFPICQCAPAAHACRCARRSAACVAKSPTSSAAYSRTVTSS